MTLVERSPKPAIIYENHLPESVFGLAADASIEVWPENPESETLQAGIKRRANSQEVGRLNDRAELAIYGSKDRVYLDESGQVIADKDHPIIGTIERIKQARSQIKPEIERERAAAVYATRVEQLIREGFELCQVKLILDHEGKDRGVRRNLIKRYVDTGLTGTEADLKSGIFLAKQQDHRKRLIKSGGAFTPDDYRRLLDGEQLYDERGEYINNLSGERKLANSGKTKEDHENPSSSKEDRKGPDAAASYAKDETLIKALTQYAQMSAVRERSVFLKSKNGRGSKSLSELVPGQKIDQDDLINCQNDFEKIRWSYRQKLRYELVKSGLDLEDINAVMKEQEKQLIARLAGELVLAKMRLDGLDAPGKLNAWRRRFYAWWAKQGGGGEHYFSRQRIKGTIKKIAVMAPFGLAGGAIAAVAAPIAGGVISAAGVAYATKTAIGLARSMTTARIDRKAEVNRIFSGDDYPSVANLQSGRRYADSANFIDQQYAEHTYTEGSAVYLGPINITEVFAQATKKEVRRNRIRLAAAVGASALGTGFAAGFSVLGEHLASSGAVEQAISHHPKKSHIPLPKHQVSPPPAPPAAPPMPPAIVPEGQPLNVSPGAGIINEIQTYAASRGKTITIQQAGTFYLNLYNSLGNNRMQMIVGAMHQPDTYLIGPSDIGISSPGTAYWGPGVEAQLDNLLNSF